jgi:hypothetical protein
MQCRMLTTGEIELARSIFKDSIDYSRVRLFEGKWWPLHPRRAAMAPTGDIWFHPDGGGWSDDFSKETLSRQGFFIHELTHVWQSQKGGRFYLLLMRHPFCRYSYTVRPGRPFRRYGIEQQAEIMRHFFLETRGVSLSNTPSLEELTKLVPFS